MFWVYYPSVRHLFANHEVFNTNNDAERRTFEDIFFKRRFSSYIYQETNVYNNRRIEDYRVGLDALLESEKIKEGASEFSEKMNNTFSGKTKKNNGLQDLFDIIGKIILAIFKVVGKFIGIIIIFVSAAVILSLVIGGFSVGSLEWLNVDGEFLHYPPFFYDSVLPIWLLTLCAFLLIGIPFLILFILGLRILSSNVRKLSKPTSLTLLGIWIVALLAMIFTGLEFGVSHSTHGKSLEKNNINIVENYT